MKYSVPVLPRPDRPLYQNLELLPIAGSWRKGAAGRSLEVTDPFSGDQLLSVPMASLADLDEAYRAAAKAQPAWAALGPGARHHP